MNPRAKPWLGLALWMATAAPIGASEPPAVRLEAPLRTRWAEQVQPDRVLPEYPRPQLVRQAWLNLNGLWDYAVTPLAAGRPTNFTGKILVPFPIESALSGVTAPLNAGSTLWYRRTFRLPAAWTGQRVRLHFGAVDWATRVFVNGRFVGEHQGGYDPFSFDLTPCLVPGGTQELVVAVTDPTEGDQPRGKQSRKPEGIFYTQASGIWQTVWLEPLPAVCVDRLRMTPDVEAAALRLRVEVASLDDSLRVEAVARADGKDVGRVAGPPNTELILPLATARLWSPDDPFLYDLTVALWREGRELDRVTSYFGLRKVGLQRDTNGVMRLALNGRTRFHIGALDQGFWPEGIYTAPTEAALRHDLEFLKAAGFDLVRKHVKVEPQRWYYWCDRLGLLVWQDMPSGNNNTRDGRRQFEAELQRLLAALQNHPSIVMWVLFNEGWGQYDTESLVEWLQTTDPSRLVNNASGWTDKQVGHVLDAHSYPFPEVPSPDGRRATVLGEFGGLGLIIPNHAWPRPWAYHMLPDVPTFQAWYGHLLQQAWGAHHTRGLAAVVYTQVTDVESECNGLLTYDRAVAKLPPETLAEIHRRRGELPPLRVLVPNALHGRPLWRYTFQPPPTNWFHPDFQPDNTWSEGPGGFGTSFTRGARVNTVWEGADIWLRRMFTLDTRELSGVQLLLHHDKDAEVYLNGVLAFRGAGHLVDYGLFDLAPAAVAALRPGPNLLAVHCRQTSGGQFIDVGLVAPQGATNTPRARP